MKLSPVLIKSTSSEQQPSKNPVCGVTNNKSNVSNLPLKFSTLRRTNAINNTKNPQNAVEVQTKSNQPPKPKLSKNALLKKKRIVPPIVSPNNITIKPMCNDDTTVITTAFKVGDNNVMIKKKILDINKDVPFKVPVKNVCPVNNVCDTKDETSSVLSLAITEFSRRWVFFCRLSCFNIYRLLQWFPTLFPPVPLTKYLTKKVLYPQKPNFQEYRII